MVDVTARIRHTRVVHGLISEYRKAALQAPETPAQSPRSSFGTAQVVDNLSGGRVGLSLASGWNPDDFVLAPSAYEDRRRLTIEGIDTLRRLWQGEPYVDGRSAVPRVPAARAAAAAAVAHQFGQR